MSAKMSVVLSQEHAKTDWIIVRDTELGNTTAQSTLDDRAAIRTSCATKEGEINAKTTKAQVVQYDISL